MSDDKQAQAPAGDEKVMGPGFYEHYNVNPELLSYNYTEDDNPTGGSVRSTGLMIDWQNGPRAVLDDEGNPTGELLPPNGAFVEDAIYAAIQRLEFFQDSKFRCRENAIAITKLQEALWAMKHRQVERSHRNVEGKHEV